MENTREILQKCTLRFVKNTSKKKLEQNALKYTHVRKIFQLLTIPARVV